MTYGIPAVHASGASMIYCLRCSDADGVTFEVPPAPESVTGFREQCQYVFELEYADPCVLVIDDVAIAALVEQGRQRWVWQPLFYAGTVHAELLSEDGTSLASYLLDVTPNPGKLGQVVFRQLVDELLAADPLLLFGEEAAQITVGALGSFSNVHLEFGRIKLFGPLLLQSLTQVCAQPLSVLRSERRLVAPHKVRRFDHHSAKTLARTPQILAAIRGHGGGAVPPDRMLFDVPKSTPDLDTPAHRALFALIGAVIRRIRKVRAELEQLGVGETNPTFRTPFAPKLPYRRKLLDELEHALRQHSRAKPFAAVRRAEVSAAGLNAIAGHPPYAAAYQRGWQLLRPGIEGQHYGETLPVSPTWEIYERWCFLCLTSILRELFPSLQWRRSVNNIDHLTEIGFADGLTVTIHLQETFRSMDQINQATRHYSISSERRPDIVIKYECNNLQRFLVFDAKYSISRASVLAAMGAAHIYRDCLRWDSRAPDFALLLIPSKGSASWLEDSHFHANHRVGVLPLSPGGGKERLRSVIQRWFGTE